jgi:hypothetical protein
MEIPMINDANIQYSISLLSDWAKWLITIETAVIAIVGSVIRSLPPESHSNPSSKNWHSIERVSKSLATATIIFFLLSIAAAAFLLLSLPEIALTIQPGTNIWFAKDSIIGSVLGVDIQSLAIIESMGFGLGMVCFSSLIVASIWSKQKQE